MREIIINVKLRQEPKIKEKEITKEKKEEVRESRYEAPVGKTAAIFCKTFIRGKQKLKELAVEYGVIKCEREWAFLRNGEKVRIVTVNDNARGFRVDKAYVDVALSKKALDTIVAPAIKLNGEIVMFKC